MKFYDLPASPNARRVRIFMAEKGLELPKVAVDMMQGENSTPEYLAKNSLGKMPVLELDGQRIGVRAPGPVSMRLSALLKALEESAS